MTDAYRTHIPGLTSPAHDAAPIVPSDSTDLPQSSRAVYVGIGGDATVRMVGGSQVTLVGLLSGAVYPLRVDRVLATGTTAAALVALW